METSYCASVRTVAPIGRSISRNTGKALDKNSSTNTCTLTGGVLDNLSLFFCRMGCAGTVPHAPGTWGSLLALLMAPVCFFPLPMIGRCLVLLVLFFLGALASTRVESILKCKDPSQIVVDEWLGMWLIFLPFTNISLSMFVTGFVLFRLFDIAKPWPVKASEQWMRQGYGIMLDDVVAACLGMLGLALVY